MILDKTKDTIIGVAAIIGSITVIAGGYVFFKYNIWKPNIELVSVDYNKGTAIIKFRGNDITIYGDATKLLGGDWGVRFGSNQDKYDRIELVKKGMVYEYIQIG